MTDKDDSLNTYVDLDEELYQLENEPQDWTDWTDVQKEIIKQHIRYHARTTEKLIKALKRGPLDKKEVIKKTENKC